LDDPQHTSAAEDNKGGFTPSSPLAIAGEQLRKSWADQVDDAFGDWMD
jgi:hypothetical protein